ncbi:hypothetical protein BDV18DRAFT_137648 [Aspergillus unguis]
MFALLFFFPLSMCRINLFVSHLLISFVSPAFVYFIPSVTYLILFITSYYHFPLFFVFL